MKKQFHIGFDESHGAQIAILPGDPGRVEKIASFLENPRFHCQNREYTSWLGEITTKDGNKKTIMVISTGMGGPSSAICIEELFNTGVKTFIRIGTCGGISLDVQGGDIVIALGAIRQEGTTKEYVPIEFPAVANLEVTNALAEACKNLKLKYHTGIVQCKDSFYGQHSPDRMPSGFELNQKWEAWKKAGTLASEMESASVFIVSQILGARAGCVLNVIWNQERKKAGLEDNQSLDTEPAIKAAIEAIKNYLLS